MKFFRTTAALVVVISLLVLNWYCKNQNIENAVSPEKTQQTDGLPDGVTLTIYEYCYITPPPGQGDPFYHYRALASFVHNVYPIGYTNGSFTTPFADRYDEYGYHYQTQYFKYSLIARNVNVCMTCNCAARYYISGNALYLDHFYCDGDCRDCPPPGGKSCVWSTEYDRQPLPENTYYTTYAGSDCIVGSGEWEIGR